MLLVLFKRLFGKNGAALTPSGDERDAPEARVERIRAGEDSRDDFIAAYEPYIAKVTSRFCKRYIDPSRDDEFSIALSAFDEAISQYSSHAGKSFLGFAETVIRRRLIDYVRREQRHSHTVPYSAFDSTDEEEQTINTIELKEAMHRHAINQEADARRLEIAEYNSCLNQYGITFAELPGLSPKHADSRELLMSISRRFAATSAQFESFTLSQKLPIKEMCAEAGVSRKTIERNRKYIIAIAILHNGDFPCLQAYLQPMLSQDEDNDGVKGVRA
ncbi:RNA polymerase sigma factor SigI [Paenibacillus oenotherae]|uniref:RNA polymerase sigma factor SigI n=1 Tax=Paenibacillus oenotherae TaxID=1435645 RepID=A0ABS7D9I4_9BACL|nr:RNA polymerase sigma factor SigI [Paenibacillus oenotherae]MBW7476617.1 RNA polymerase sigma factor SigI [Paenibacillus oenotherae]